MKTRKIFFFLSVSFFTYSMEQQHKTNGLDKKSEATVQNPVLTSIPEKQKSNPLLDRVKLQGSPIKRDPDLLLNKGQG